MVQHLRIHSTAIPGHRVGTPMTAAATNHGPPTEARWVEEERIAEPPKPQGQDSARNKLDPITVD